MLRRENSAKKIAEQYAGTGKSFQVKFLGTDSVSNTTGDAAAADCMKRLRKEHKQARPRVQLPKVTITLQFKGLAVFDERSKSVTLRVPVEKITYVCHDPETASVFAILVKSEDTGPAATHKLFAFKTDQKTAVSFVRSARELFQLMYKLMKAKKEQLEAGPLSEEERHPDSKEELASAPAVTMTTISPPPPPYDQLQESDAMQEWSSLDKELKQIAKDLGMEEDPPSSQVQPNLCLQPTPFDAPQNQDPFLDSFFQKSFTSPAALPSDSGSSPFASFSNTTPGSTSGQQPTVNLFTSTPEGQRAPPLVQPLESQTAQQGISLLLDPFQTSSGMSDPFQASSGVSDPFQASSGPFQTSSGVSDPFQASSGPFQTSSGVSDPFQASSGPFQTSSGVSDPFQASTGPFQASSSVNNPLQASSGMNNPLQASSGMNDLLQNPSGMASNFSVNQPQQYQGVPSPANSYNITAGSDSTLELSNPLYQSQDTSSYTVFSGHQQPPSQQIAHDPFGFEIGGQTQHSFVPQFPAALVPGPSSFSTGPPGNFMVPANNPFASDFDSSSLFSMPQSTFSQSAKSSGYPPNPKRSISGNAGDAQDLFAELIPLAVGASPSRKISAAKQPDVKQQEEHATEFGTINFEDIKVQRPKKTEEQTQPDESSLTGKPLEEKRNQNSDVVEDSFLHASDQQKVSNEIFQKPSSRGELLKTANGHNSQEPLHKDALTSTFGNDLSTFSDFETAFASADSENDKRNISEAFESPTSVAPPPSLITFDTGFDDHFVADNADATSNTPSGSNGDDFWGGKTESTATSWIAFS